MSILDEQKERKWVEPLKSFAQKIYEKQLKDITNISHTEWYKQIKDYWIRVRDWEIEQLKTVKEEELKVTQMKYQLASGFITFLNNLEDVKKTKAMVKEL